MFRQLGLACGKDFFVERITVGIHSHHDRESDNLKFPNSLGRSELLHHIHVRNSLDAFGQYLRSPTNCVQVSAAILLAGSVDTYSSWAAEILPIKRKSIKKYLFISFYAIG